VSATANGTRIKPPLSKLLLLSVAALGVVFGDIGTSPIYTFSLTLDPAYHLSVDLAHVLGVLSLILWSLILTVSVKYLILVLRADNHGEGGILALTSLVTPLNPVRRSGLWLLLLLGIFGATLLYGDGVITPAISVLSAVEGLQIVSPSFTPYVLPITAVILILLFVAQSRGTQRVGNAFGPILIVWFLVLASLGVIWILKNPVVLASFNPYWALRFVLHQGFTGFVVLGSVFLAVTGAEALYADIGHFGKGPIRISWFALVFPALLINYLGQGAFVLAHPRGIANPFFEMAPAWSLFPLVILATVATIIASQAIVSGAFSLTVQAIRLGYAPRLEVRHTSDETYGQVYVPTINWLMMLACLALVFIFRSSDRLGAAYGVAITTTMVITTVMLYVVAKQRWKWPPALILPITAVLGVVDLTFFLANMLKIVDGGWVPLVLALSIFTMMTTWKRGRRLISQGMHAANYPISAFIRDLTLQKPLHSRVPGTAVFLHSDPAGTPPALLANLRWNKVLHQTVLLVSILTEEVPRIGLAKRISAKSLGQGFYQISLHYGFMETVNLSGDLAQLHLSGVELRPEEFIYLVGRAMPTPRSGKAGLPGMSRWRVSLFMVMARNVRSAMITYRLPPDRVIELGTQVEL
jgi:KUP system potassium uptake protein